MQVGWQLLDNDFVVVIGWSNFGTLGPHAEHTDEHDNYDGQYDGHDLRDDLGKVTFS
jgi:hypothetical protein